MNFKFKNSTKGNFAVNLLLVMIAAVLTFMGAKMFGAKVGVVVYAIAIAVCFYKVAIQAIEKIISGKVHYTLISLVSVLVIFASQKFLLSSIVAIIFSLSMTIYEALSGLVSSKLLEDDEYKIKYVLENGETVFADDLSEGDVVKVTKDELLVFDYLYTNKNGEEKKFSAGKFNADDEALVKVVEYIGYEIDFDETAKDKNSKVFKIVSLVSNIYTLVMVAVAILLFVLDFVSSKAMLQSLYVLGVYLIFANPLVINSGIFAAGLLSLKDLKAKGVKLCDVSDLEKLSTVKKVFISKDLALEDETKANEKVVKAVKIADVLGVETELLSDENEEKTSVYAKTIGFKNYKSEVEAEKEAEIVDAPLKKGISAFVTSKEVCAEKAFVVSTEKKEGNRVCKCKLGEFIKAVKYSKVFGWFAYARVAVGAVVNTAILALYASKKPAQIIANKLVLTDAETFKGKLLTALVQYEMLTPWIICGLQLILINLLLFVALAFITDEKK